MAEFASNGVAGTGLGLGIAGTALGVMAGGLNNGGIGGLFGNGYVASEDKLVNRYELGQAQEIESLKSQIALRDANTYADQKLLEVYKYFDGELKAIRETQNTKWTEQAVINCQHTTGLSVLKSQVDAVTATVNSITRTAVPTSAICDFCSPCCNNNI